MKINELLKEGLGGYASAFAKGVAKGVANMVAPGAVDDAKGALHKAKQQAGYATNRKTQAYAQAKDKLSLTPQQELVLNKTVDDAMRQAYERASQQPSNKQSSFSKWSKSQVAEQASIPTITVDEIKKLLTKNQAPNDATGLNYVASRLAEKGVKVQGYTPAKGTVADIVSKDTRSVDILLSRAQRSGKSSMAEIAKYVPTTGQYSNKTVRDNKIKEVAKYLTQQGIDVQGYQMAAEPETVDWDANKNVLTVSGPEGAAQYRRYTGGRWMDVATGEIIKPEYAKELQVKFDTITGRVPFPGGKPKTQGLAINQVKAPNGEVITKDQGDNRWYDEQGNYISNPEDLKRLERQFSIKKTTPGANPQWAEVKLKTQTAQSTTPAAQPAQQSAPPPEPTPEPAQPAAAPADNIPDVSGLTPEDRAELIKQIKQKLGQA